LSVVSNCIIGRCAQTSKTKKGSVPKYRSMSCDVCLCALYHMYWPSAKMYDTQAWHLETALTYTTDISRVTLTDISVPSLINLVCEYSLVPSSYQHLKQLHAAGEPFRIWQLLS